MRPSRLLALVGLCCEVLFVGVLVVYHVPMVFAVSIGTIVAAVSWVALSYEALTVQTRQGVTT